MMIKRFEKTTQGGMEVIHFQSNTKGGFTGLVSHGDRKIAGDWDQDGNALTKDGELVGPHSKFNLVRVAPEITKKYGSVPDVTGDRFFELTLADGYATDIKLIDALPRPEEQEPVGFEEPADFANPVGGTAFEGGLL